MYEALREVGFTADDIELAMMTTVCQGGDLYDTLDWLCLNLPNGKYYIESFYASFQHILSFHSFVESFCAFKF